SRFDPVLRHLGELPARRAPLLRRIGLHRAPGAEDPDDRLRLPAVEGRPVAARAPCRGSGAPGFIAIRDPFAAFAPACPPGRCPSAGRRTVSRLRKPLLPIHPNLTEGDRLTYPVVRNRLMTRGKGPLRAVARGRACGVSREP